MSYPIQPPEDNKSEAQQLYSQYQMAVSQLQHFESQESQILSVIDELSLNLSTIDGIGKYQPLENEIIIPMGGMILLKAKLTGDEILVNIGSEVIVPKSVDEAKDIVEKRLNEMTVVYKQLSTERQKLEEIASRLQAQMNQLSSQ